MESEFVELEMEFFFPCIEVLGFDEEFQEFEHIVQNTRMSMASRDCCLSDSSRYFQLILDHWNR